MWSNSEYIWPNAQRNWPNARALTNCVRIWPQLVGLTKCAAHLGGQTRSAVGQKRAFGQMPRILSIGQMRSAFGSADWSNAPYTIIKI